MSGKLLNGRAFVAAFITVALILVVVEIEVRSALSDQALKDWPEDSFLAHERDDHGRLMAGVFAARSEDPPPGGHVFVIGGSTVREGLLPDAVIQRGLSDALGAEAPEIHTLYSFDQTMAETARVALNLPLQHGDTLVIGVNPRRLSFGEPALAREFVASRFSLLSNESLRALAATDTIAAITGNEPWLSETRLLTPWDSLAVFEHRLFMRNWVEGRLNANTVGAWDNLFGGKLGDVDWLALADVDTRNVRRPLRYAYGDQALTKREKAEIAAAVASTRIDAFFEHSPVDFAILQSLIETQLADDVYVILLELPRAQSSTDVYGPVWADYETGMSALVEAGATRLDLRNAPFGDDDFYDLEHLLAPFRPDLTDMFFEELLGAELDLEQS